MKVKCDQNELTKTVENDNVVNTFSYLQIVQIPLSCEEILKQDSRRESVFVIRNVQHCHAGHLERQQNNDLILSHQANDEEKTAAYNIVIVSGFRIGQCQHRHQGVSIPGEQPKIHYSEI